MGRSKSVRINQSDLHAFSSVGVKAVPIILVRIFTVLNWIRYTIEK